MALDCSLTVQSDDDGINFTVTAENVGTEPIDLTFSDGQTVEVVLEDDGVEIWRYSGGRMFTQALRTETVEPGESFAETVTWRDPDPGEYGVRAWCCANGVDWTAERTLSV